MKDLKKNSAFITKAASLLTIVAGCLVLAGWIFNIPSFKSVLPGIITIKFNTAVCFILSGIALYLLDAPAISQTRKTIASVCSCIILIFGILNLSEYIFGYNLGIDELLWKEGPGTVATTFPGRMSISTALNFTLLGVIFIMLGKRKYHWPIQILLIAMIPGSLLVIFNYLFGISFLNSIPELNNTALHTAILFIILSLGVFFSSALGYLHFSFMKKIAGFFVLIFLVRSIIFFAINKNNELAADMDRRVEHTHEVLFMAEKVNAQSDKIQNEARGYIITGKENFQLLFNNTADTIENIIARFRTITKEDAGLQLRIDLLEKHLNTYLAFQKELVNIRRMEGFEAAQKIILNGRGELLLNKVHSIVTTIEQEENQFLSKRKDENEQIILNSSRLFKFFQLIGALLLLAALKMIYDNSRLRNKVEDILKRSLKDISDYKHALNESSILVITDQNGIIRHVNDNFCKITKYTRDELLGHDHCIINSGYHAKEFIRDLWITVNNGEVWKGEIKNKAKDGSYFWLDSTIVPFMNEHGKPYQYVAIQSDITERKGLEVEIKEFNLELQKKVREKAKEIIEKEQQYRFLLQNMREGIQLIGYDWRYLFVNNSLVGQSKYSNEELLGYTMMEKYPGIENTELFKVLQRCMKNRNPEVIENEFAFPDGTKGWFELSIQSVPEGLFILSMDITDRKKAERKLLESIDRYELVNKATQDIIWEWDLETNEIFRSPAFLTIFGYNNEKITSNRDWVFNKIHPDDYEKVVSQLDYCIKNNIEKWQKSYRFLAADGTYKYVYDRAFVLFNENGKPRRMIGAMTDLTEKKRLERELSEQSLKQHKLLMEVTIQAQEEEKNELGRELHDNINQIMATVKMYLGMAKSGKKVSEDLIGMSYEYVNQAMEEIRKLSHSLVAPSLSEISLKEALQQLIEDINLLNGLQVQLLVDENFNEHGIDKNKELMFYRIVQEQLNNITKYAQAKEVVISIKTDNGNLFLSIADNGVGFDTSQKSKGIGLKNIKSRVDFYTGCMNVISAPGQGCTLEICITL